MKISKLTDYSLLIVSQLSDSKIISANKVSEQTHVPLATTNKILKLLNKSKICSSKGGKSGGFLLSKSHNSISLLDVVNAIEGSNNITQCVTDDKCQLQLHCKISQKMQIIDKEINLVLSKKFISDLI